MHLISEYVERGSRHYQGDCFLPTPEPGSVCGLISLDLTGFALARLDWLEHAAAADLDPS
jgi:hypothetical protein